MKKKIISLLSALALTAYIVPCALADNNVKVYVNDTEMVTDAPIIIENNRTLVPVRAILEYLDYNVDWDNDTQTVIISKNLTTLKFTIDNLEAILEFIFYEETVDGKVHLEVAPQIINDTTYIPLSDVAKAFALNITWDSDNREVHITQYKKGDLTPLIEFGIISDDDLNKGEYITTQEALNAIKNFQHYNVDDFKNLYIYDYLKSFDNISDESKILLSVLERTVLTLDDIININLEGNLTNLQALTYVGRLTGISYSSDSDNVYDRSEPNEIYDYAYQNNLIENKDTSNAQSPITRENFYDLLNKVLFCNHYAVDGGIFKAWNWYYNLARRTNNDYTDNYTEPSVVSEKISPEIKFNNDMSVEWTLPEDFDGEVVTKFLAYTSDKQCKSIYEDGVTDELTAENIIKLFATSYPQTFDYIRCIYSVADNTNTLYEWYFDIDTTKIRTVMDRKELTPGTFIATNDWDYQSKNYISLDKGKFKPNVYYLINTRYSDYEPGEELDFSKFSEYDNVVFTVPTETSKFFYDENQDRLSDLSCLNTDDVHIQEVTVTGNAKSGFTIHTSPMSEMAFKSEEVDE